MKYLVIIGVLILSACQGAEYIKEPLFHPTKTDSTRLLESVDNLLPIQEIEGDSYSFVSVEGWFDQDNLLYSSDESGLFHLYKHHLWTGNKEVFLTFDSPISVVYPSPDYEWFAVQTEPIHGGDNFHIYDSNGLEKSSREIEGIDFELFWNPYRHGEGVIGVLTESFETALLFFSVKNNTWEVKDGLPYYAQWLTENEVAYLDWAHASFGFEAPIYSLDLSKGNQNSHEVQQDVVTFFGLGNDLYLAVRAQNKEEFLSSFQLYNHSSVDPLTTWESPSLMMYSSDWWIPNLTFNDRSLFYFEPRTSGDIYEYENSFTLNKLDLVTLERTELTAFRDQKPIQISPDGKYLLIGNYYEQLITLYDLKEVNLLPFLS